MTFSLRRLETVDTQPYYEYQKMKQKVLEYRANKLQFSTDLQLSELFVEKSYAYMENLLRQAADYIIQKQKAPEMVLTKTIQRYLDSEQCIRCFVARFVHAEEQSVLWMIGYLKTISSNSARILWDVLKPGKSAHLFHAVLSLKVDDLGLNTEQLESWTLTLCAPKTLKSLLIILSKVTLSQSHKEKMQKKLCFEHALVRAVMNKLQN